MASHQYFFGGKYDLIQLHRQIIHYNDGICFAAADACLAGQDQTALEHSEKWTKGYFRLLAQINFHK